VEQVAGGINGGLGRVVIFLMVVVAAVGGIMFYGWWAFGGTVEANEEPPTAVTSYTPADLGGSAKELPVPAGEVEDEPGPGATAKTDAKEQARKQEEEKSRKELLAEMRARSAGRMVVVKAAPPKPPPSVVPYSPELRHVPRGTIMQGFLESRVVSDNLDSRVRVRLLEDLVLSGDVILPKNGEFIGDVAAVMSRYQHRIAVRVTNYIYPDKEREVEVAGFLLNPDESAHLMADDIKHHSGKVIAGIIGLEAFRALTGSIGSRGGSGNDVLVNFGQGLGDGAQTTMEPRFQDLQQILPTMIVEPGKAVLIFVDQSFDVPMFRDLPKRYVGARRGDSGEEKADPQQVLSQQLDQLKNMMASIGPPPTGDRESLR